MRRSSPSKSWVEFRLRIQARVTQPRRYPAVVAPTMSRRYGLVLASLATAALAALVAATISLWALCVLPFTLIIGICAWRGLTLTETWNAMDDGSEQDLGRGPAGMGF